MPFFVTLVAVVLGIVLFLVVEASFLLWGAKIANIANRTLGKALAATTVAGIATFVLNLILGFAPGIGNAAATIVGFIISALVTMSFFDTSFAKALAANILAWLLGLLVLGGIVLLLILFGGLTVL